MARRLIGTGTTDANGNVIIPYVGTGAGLVNLVAEATIDGSLVSEIYGLIDGLVFDTCTGAVTGRWYNFQNMLSVSYDENGMTVTKTEQDTNARYFYWNDTAISTTKIGGYNTITTPMCIEFKCNQITGSVQLVFNDNASPVNQRFIDITTTGQYRIVLNGKTVKIYCDGVEVTNPSNPLALTGANTQFRFGFNAPNESITIKDFVIYPI